MSERARCADCVSKNIPKPLFAAYDDGKCFNHSKSPEAVRRRRDAGAKGGSAGLAEAKARKAKRIAGRGKGRGLAAADAPERPERPHRKSPPIDFSSVDAVSVTMERIATALLNDEVEPDAARVAHLFCETAQKLRAPKGGGQGSGKQEGKILRFPLRQPPPETAPDDAGGRR